MLANLKIICQFQGRIQDFKLGGGVLKKLRRAEGGSNMFEVFRVKNHDFTPKNHIFSYCGGRREHFWGISCEKSRSYAKKKNHIFSNFRGGGGAPGAPPAGSAPEFHAHSVHQNSVEIYWAEIYRGRLYLRADIYLGRLLTLITGSSSRLLRIRFSADLTMYWFPVYHFRCMKFKPLVIWIWNQNIAISKY